MGEKNLKKVLKECENSAKTGYKIASEKEKVLSKVLNSASDKVKNTIENFNSSPLYMRETNALLEVQLNEINDAFNNLTFAFKENLQNRRENMSQFSITLFGRTMAGKSTLIEILTNGDGDSIGKGAQRTTKDFRECKWNGMTITDVPGIGAFEGEEDEIIAYKAAEKADLILFLLTDDAPQVAEAECFSEIVKSGKPIICIMNVKASIAEDKSLKLALRDVNKRFDMERLEKIRNQFLAYSEQFGQTWSQIPFVYVHLKSAYMALKTKDKDKKKSFHEVSRIEDFEKMLEEQVEINGKFYRINNFIDSISKPILESLENLLKQSQKNSEQGQIIREKKIKYEKWKDDFDKNSRGRIKSLIVEIKSELNREIAFFAEENFDNKKAGDAWEKLLESKKLASRCQELLEELVKKSNDELKEISREITNELKFAISFESDKSLKMNKIIDDKKIWRWSTLTISSGLSIAAMITPLAGAAAVSGPLAGAALGVVIIGEIVTRKIDSRSKQEDKARSKLEEKLRDNVSRICNKLENQMNKKLESLESVSIKKMIDEMDKICSVVSQLADTQKELAWKLNGHMLDLNKRIFTEAIRQIRAEGLQYHAKSVARIPGEIYLILINEGTVFPKEETDALCNLIGNKIDFVYDSEDMRVLISRILGGEIDMNRINVDKKMGVAHITLGDVTNSMENRIRLAQQFSELLILKE